MGQMERYEVTLNGLTPLLLHNDNLGFNEKIERWRKDPANKALSQAGDDRSPAFTWIGYLYHAQGKVGVSADNLMTMLRESGAKITKKGKESYKKQTQSGLLIDTIQFDILVNGQTVPTAPINEMIGVTEFDQHMDLAESLGFELFVKRAAIGRAKHVRVRPMFREWQLKGTMTILDTELYGINKSVLEQILTIGGAQVGLCDWRPSSGASGPYGKFTPEVKRIK